jgi:oligoribonuclease NrnB/cAMP/cGMP phosphodiesterase (DHH superfamily)
MICIYHSRDLDGWMSAAIVKLKFPNVTLVGWDYGQPVPDIAFKEVILVDVTLPTMFMVDNVNRITWIDHHFSAIKQMSELEPLPFFHGLRNDKFAACELTWQFFFPDEPMPEIVRLLGRYDCFGHKGTDEEKTVLEFQYAARAYWGSVEDCFYALQNNDARVVSLFSELGKGIYAYLCTEAEQTYAKRFVVKFADYKFACVNQERFNPVNFGIDYHKDGYDGFACFWYANGRWTFSLYNDNGKVDCSEICKQNGGGGHKGAAGFVKDDINWLFQHATKA